MRDGLFAGILFLQTGNELLFFANPLLQNLARCKSINKIDNGFERYLDGSIASTETAWQIGETRAWSIFASFLGSYARTSFSTSLRYSALDLAGLIERCFSCKSEKSTRKGIRCEHAHQSQAETFRSNKSGVNCGRTYLFHNVFVVGRQVAKADVVHVEFILVLFGDEVDNVGLHKRYASVSFHWQRNAICRFGANTQERRALTVIRRR